jgi:hypothetical protein
MFETPSGQVVIRNGNGGKLRWLRGMHKAVHGLGGSEGSMGVAMRLRKRIDRKSVV